MFLIILAILPAAVLGVYIYQKDRGEKDPLPMLAWLFVLGGLTTVSAVIIGVLAETLVTPFVKDGSLAYILIENFLLVALVEEGGKYFVLKKRTWKSPEFNYTFDAVVYAIVVSLGFATVENILYVSGDTIHTAIMRGILAVPGHAIDGVFMGFYYGLARQARGWGDEQAVRQNLRRALWVPVLTHGFYDFCLSMESDAFFTVFIVFEIVITILAIRKVNRLSREDAPIV